MKANKVTVEFKVEALSIDCIGSLTGQAVDQIQAGYECGSLEADDGDYIEWRTKREEVEF